MKLSFIQRMECPLCFSEAIKTIFKKSYNSPDVADFLRVYYQGRIQPDNLDADYTISVCNCCSLVFQKNILDERSSLYLYETVICPQSSLNKREMAPPEYFSALFKSASVVNEFVPSARAAREIKVLDFGMGWGHWAMAAKACGYTVKGCELSASRIKFAENHGVNVATDLRKDNDQYDFINTDQVFEHLSNPYETGESLARKLKPGGILKIFVPNGGKTKQKISKGTWAIGKNELHPLEHINCFSREALFSFCHKIGLSPVGPKDFSTTKSKLKAIIHLTARRSPSWYFVKRS